MGTKSIASVPGKTILLGEHVVVYPPHKAVLTTIDLRCVVSSEVVGESGEIEFIDLKYPEDTFNTTIQECLDNLVTIRKYYDDFIVSGNISKLKEYLKKDYAFLKTFIGLPLEVAIKKKGVFPSLKITRNIELPFGSGFGASASIAASFSASILKACGIDATKEDIYNLSYEYEKFSHGNPSGADPAIVVYGEFVEFYKDLNQEKIINPLKIQNPDLKKYLNGSAIIHTGSSNESTGEMVTFVKDQYASNKEKYESIFDKIEMNTDRFLKLLNEEICDEQTFIEIINVNGILLEEMGVVSDIGKRICHEIRSKGGAAKVSGGGGKGNGPCGALFVYHQDSEFLNKIANEFKVTLYKKQFGISGLEYN